MITLLKKVHALSLDIQQLEKSAMELKNERMNVYRRLARLSDVLDPEASNSMIESTSEQVIGRFYVNGGQ